MELHSTYHYPVVLNTQLSNSPTSFINIEDMLFEVFKDESSNTLDSIALTQFIRALENSGLRRTDPRLREMVTNIEKFTKKGISEIVGRSRASSRCSGRLDGTGQNGDDSGVASRGSSVDTEGQRISRKQFKELIINNIVLISRAWRHQFIIPEFKWFSAQIEDIFVEADKVRDGRTAKYIPQLAREDPNQFGMSICTIDGQRFSKGDSSTKFSLQSVVKALNYAIVLNELGRDTVHKYLGMEPSGRKFNDMELDHNNQPHNPLVNAGAILTISLIQQLVKPDFSKAEQFDYILNYFKRMAGGEYIGFNNSIFLAEREHSDRNYALGYYLKENKCFPPGTNLKNCLDLWYQCCSMEVTCETIAVIGGTLANGGVCPITREQVLKPEAVRDVLSLLHSCGFYEYSGAFAFKVGIPGKSSVAGSLCLALPNTMGIGLWSPGLDKYGNSYKGMAFMELLSQTFNFHRYEGKELTSKVNPRRVVIKSRGDTIVSLMFAAAAGDLSALKRHKLLGHDMGASDYDGRTPLHLVAAEGHTSCVAFLLHKCNVHPDPTDRWGFTPESEAERFGHMEIAGLLKLWTIKDQDTLTARDDFSWNEFVPDKWRIALDEINSYDTNMPMLYVES